MNSLVKAWNPTENYWSLHPMMTTLAAFKEYHAQDKTKGKVESSRVMWAIAMLLDPHADNALRSIERADRIRIISEDFLEAPDFDWDHTYVDGMMINTSKLNVEYRGLTAALEAEENAGDMKGGATESAGESGAL